MRVNFSYTQDLVVAADAVTVIAVVVVMRKDLTGVAARFFGCDA